MILIVKILSLLGYKNKVFEKDENNIYLVETIWFDDILDYLPKNKKNKNYEKAILKIDIEGFEPYAFIHAKRLFDSIDIPIIFMEWGYFPKLVDAYKEIENMIEFLFSYKLEPYAWDGRKLEKQNWRNWTWDIYWLKDEY